MREDEDASNRSGKRTKLPQEVSVARAMLEKYDDDSFSRETQPLTDKQKVQNFWYYHWYYFVIGVVVIAAAVYGIIAYKAAQKDYYLYIAVVNAETQSDFLGTDYSSAKNLPDTDEIMVNDAFRHIRESEGDVALSDDVVASVQKFNMLLQKGTIDIAVMNELFIEEYEGEGFVDLRTILPESVFENNDCEFFYIKDDSGNQIPIGIYTDSIDEFDEIYAEDTDRYVITISDESDRQEQIEDYILWLVS